MTSWGWHMQGALLSTQGKGSVSTCTLGVGRETDPFLGECDVNKAQTLCISGWSHALCFLVQQTRHPLVLPQHQQLNFSPHWSSDFSTRTLSTGLGKHHYIQFMFGRFTVIEIRNIKDFLLLNHSSISAEVDGTHLTKSPAPAGQVDFSCPGCVCITWIKQTHLNISLVNTPDWQACTVYLEELSY